MQAEAGAAESAGSRKPESRRLLYVVLMLAFGCITAWRLIGAYSTLSGTYDEPFHLVAGMEWLEKGKYTYDLSHPPVARAVLAAIPYLAGLRGHPSRNEHHSLDDAPGDGNAILLSGGNYQHALMLARLGNIPFLILACAILYLWARRWFALPAGIWAVLLFLNLPPVLGHAALATLDLACASTLMAALYAWMRWLEEPDWRRTLILSLAVGLAFSSKFSNLTFMAVGVAVITFCFVAGGRNRSALLRQWRARIAQLGATAVLVFLIMWGGYRFHVAPLSTVEGYRPPIEKWFAGKPALFRAAQKAVETPIPMPQLTNGLLTLFYHAKLGHPSYLLGEFRFKGWWYFFPIVLAVKTPLGFLVLGFGGLAIVLWRIRPDRWQHTATALLPIALLLFCMTSRIDLGVRHILAIYPPLALLAGCAVWVVFEQPSRILRALCLLVAATVILATSLAHPDYLTYFNPIAGSHPEKILAESDLDWGQDLQRLSLRLRSLGVQDVALKYFGTAPVESMGLPPYRAVSATGKTTGYIAISVRFLTMEYAKNKSFAWLKAYQPLERIGSSIYLYRIAD
jgi:hypothetical protein